MLHTFIPKLAGHKILVVGDVILDEYLHGNATRMSREAPIPVLEFERRRLIPGGASNPAANVVALGSRALQVGVVGDDSAAHDLQELLDTRGIDTSGLVRDPSRPTTVKTRIMAQMGLRFPQQVARLDTLSRESISASIEEKIFTYVTNHINDAAAVLVSDYHAGLLTTSLVDEIRHLGAQVGTILTADAQGELTKYHDFSVVKCNADEARSYLQRELSTNAGFATAAHELRQMLNLTGGMVITRGPDGATVAAADGTTYHCPAPAVTDVYDTVGAGDTAITVITLAFIAGATVEQAATLANYGSGLVVRRVGNYAPSPQELAWALSTWTLNSSGG